MNGNDPPIRAHYAYHRMIHRAHKTMLALLALLLVAPTSTWSQSPTKATLGLTSRFVKTSQSALPHRPVYRSASEEAAHGGSTLSGWRMHRRPLHDLGYAGRTMLYDVGFIYSSPVRLNKRNLLWLGGIAAVGAVIYAYDQEIHDAFQRSRDDKLYKPIRRTGEEIETTGYMGTTNKYYLGAILAG